MFLYANVEEEVIDRQCLLNILAGVAFESGMSTVVVILILERTYRIHM